jgi:outer membrane lipoprotein SlyB
LTYLGGFLGYEIGLEAIIPITSIIGIVSLSIIAKAVKSIYDKFKEIGIEIKNSQ